jgi:hypothetical protein
MAKKKEKMSKDLEQWVNHLETVREIRILRATKAIMLILPKLVIGDMDSGGNGGVARILSDPMLLSSAQLKEIARAAVVAADLTEV